MGFQIRHTTVLIILAMMTQVACLKQSGNHPPVIESIELYPSETFVPGADITVSAVIVDRDGDPLEYFWESQGGLLSDPTARSTNWELYTTAEPLSFEKISLTVSDGIESVTTTKTIQVSEGLIISGFVYFEGTTIPVPGVDVSIGKYSITTKEDGHYIIGNLREENYQVSASRDGFEMFEATVYVDNPKSSFNIPMSSPSLTSRLSGTIKTIDNLTRGGLQVILLNPDGTESDLSGITGEDGYYEIAGVPHGTRNLLIRSNIPESHFLNDSIIFHTTLDQTVKSHDARIKIKRTIIADSYLSEQDKWLFEGDISDGFYLIGKGQQLSLREYFELPEDAEKALLYLNSYVVGGCAQVGKLPSHRVWISNSEGEYVGGISWGGEGSNFEAELSWHPSELPTFLNIYGKQLKVNLELNGENNCVSDPLWRVYEIGFSYYH